MNDEWIIRDLFDQIPALGELRGVARLNAEQVIRDVVSDVIENYIADCEMVAITGGAP